MIPQIIAHRGASEEAPENTLAAFQLAWDQGADAIEMDLRLSRDGQIVVIHDADLRRVAGDSRRVQDLTAAELAGVTTGKGSGRLPGGGSKVPLLGEVLAGVPAGKRVFLECKTGPEILPLLRGEIAASGLEAGQVALIGFELALVAAAKRLMPCAEVSWVVDYPGLTGFSEVLRKAVAAGVDGVDLSVRWPLAGARVSQAHAAGLKVYVWTVDDGIRAAKLARAGVDGLTTNAPLRLRRAL